MNQFQKMALAKQKEIAELKRQKFSLSELKASSKSFSGALLGTTPRIIAEIKRGDPRVGQYSNAPDLPRIIEIYDKCAAAISIVVEKQFFSDRSLIFVLPHRTRPNPF